MKIEGKRKMQSLLMQHNISYEELSKEILENIKKELDFGSEIFRVHNIQAFS